MRVIRAVRRMPVLADGCALTIGNFDGLHLGHRAIIEALCRRAAQLAVPSAIMSFEPMPATFFDPDNAPPRLSSLREKIAGARAFGLDLFVCARFDSAFAAMSPEAFLQELLDRRLRTRYVLVGEDFRFGRSRAGDIGTLRAFAAQRGIEVAPLPEVCIDGARVSSTRVRAALGAGDVAGAARLLGRPYRVSGRVATGERLGRTLGFPTINLHLRRKPALRYGVYGTRVQLGDGRCLDGAASFGVRPTVNGREALLEVYLLDFEGDLYGHRVGVSFITFVREEQRFDSLAELTERIQCDVDTVRAQLTQQTAS